jgi:hypothetical protein
MATGATSAPTHLSLCGLFHPKGIFEKGNDMPKTFADIPITLSPEELARITHRNPASVRRGIREGRIPADKVNGCWVIFRDRVFRHAAEGLAAEREGDCVVHGD